MIEQRKRDLTPQSPCPRLCSLSKGRLGLVLFHKMVPAEPPIVPQTVADIDPSHSFDQPIKLLFGEVRADPSDSVGDVVFGLGERYAALRFP
jgi:hypothetical protein